MKLLVILQGIYHNNLNMITEVTNKLHNAVDELSKQINDFNRYINVRVYGQYFVDKAAEYIKNRCYDNDISAKYDLAFLKNICKLDDKMQEKIKDYMQYRIASAVETAYLDGTKAGKKYYDEESCK